MCIKLSGYIQIMYSNTCVGCCKLVDNLVDSGMIFLEMQTNQTLRLGFLSVVYCLTKVKLLPTALLKILQCVKQYKLQATMFCFET